MDGPLVFYVALLLGGAALSVANVRALMAWRRNNPPPLEWGELGPRFAMYGTFGAVAIGGFAMTVFGLIGLLS